MSDHPTVPQPEANFMIAAEHAISVLQAQAAEAASNARAAKAAADRADASARKWKRLTVVLGFAIALLIVVAGVTGYFVNQTRINTNGLKVNAVSSCQTGNAYRTSQTKIWDELFNLSYAQQAPNKKSHVYAVQQEFLKYVHTTNAPRDCNAVISNNAAGG